MPVRFALQFLLTDAPVFLAQERGYFAEQGLDVELTNIASTAPSIQAMVAGEVQLVGVDPGASIQASLGGADVVLLFAGSNRPLRRLKTRPVDCRSKPINPPPKRRKVRSKKSEIFLKEIQFFYGNCENK